MPAANITNLQRVARDLQLLRLRRDEIIRELGGQHTQRELAEAAGLTHSGIAKILKKGQQ